MPMKQIENYKHFSLGFNNDPDRMIRIVVFIGILWFNLNDLIKATGITNEDREWEKKSERGGTKYIFSGENYINREAVISVINTKWKNQQRILDEFTSWNFSVIEPLRIKYEDMFKAQQSNTKYKPQKTLMDFMSNNNESTTSTTSTISKSINVKKINNDLKKKLSLNEDTYITEENKNDYVFPQVHNSVTEENNDTSNSLTIMKSLLNTLIETKESELKSLKKLLETLK